MSDSVTSNSSNKFAEQPQKRIREWKIKLKWNDNWLSTIMLRLSCQRRPSIIHPVVCPCSVHILEHFAQMNTKYLMWKLCRYDAVATTHLPAIVLSDDGWIVE